MNGEFTLDLSSEGGYNVASIDYPEGTSENRIINDIKKYFDEDIIPELSEVDKFHVSEAVKRYDPNRDSETFRKTLPVLRGIGQKSIGELNNNQLESLKVWEKLYYKMLGIKSPFYRARIGEWRDSDTKTAVKIVKAKNSERVKSGKTINEDTNRPMSWDNKFFGETKSHQMANGIATQIAGNIKEIAENAILLDTEISSHDSTNKPKDTAFMHSFYTLVDYDDGIYLMKL